MIEQLQQASYAIGQQMYAQQQQAGPQQAGPQQQPGSASAAGPQEGPIEEDVVEGEFREM